MCNWFWIKNNFGWISILSKENIGSLAFVKNMFGWKSKCINKIFHLLSLILTWKKRNPRIKFSQNTSSTPHINFLIILHTKSNFGCPIISWLDISIFSLILKATWPHINNLNTRFVVLSKEYIFGFQITMNYVVILHKLKSS